MFALLGVVVVVAVFPTLFETLHALWQLAEMQC